LPELTGYLKDSQNDYERNHKDPLGVDITHSRDSGKPKALLAWEKMMEVAREVVSLDKLNGFYAKQLQLANETMVVDPVNDTKRARYKAFLSTMLSIGGQELFLVSAIALGKRFAVDMSYPDTADLYSKAREHHTRIKSPVLRGLAEQNRMNRTIWHPRLDPIAIALQDYHRFSCIDVRAIKTLPEPFGDLVTKNQLWQVERSANDPGSNSVSVYVPKTCFEGDGFVVFRLENGDTYNFTERLGFPKHARA